MGVEEELREEIKKWATRLDGILSRVNAKGERAVEMLSNIKAYREDSQHFFERGSLVKSFECLIWAWAILELGRELGFFEVRG